MTLSEMNGPQLVEEYNKLAALNGAKPVKRFASTAAGLKRIEALKEGKVKVAKPKKEKVAKEKKPKVAKVKKEKEEKRSKIGIEFDVRSGSKREKLLEAMHSNYKKPLTGRELLKLVYGSTSEDNKGAVNMVMRGLDVMITNGKLPYKIVKEKNEQKEITFALHPK